MSATSSDLLIVGAGVVGLTTALAWRGRHPEARVTVLEKESDVGAHASGRNSGVLHSGLYYPPGTVKARFAREGNRRMAALCEEEGLPLRRCGKLVVAQRPEDLAMLDELERRARANEVPLERVDEKQMAEIEPRARTAGQALFAPETCAVDPGTVMQALLERCRRVGVDVRLGTRWIGGRGEDVLTSGGLLRAGYLLNTAGLHADRVAEAWGHGSRFQILPFRGLYLVSEPGAPDLRCHVYPVPDLELPFLGVHFTVRARGGLTIGPTAQPALWREQYGGLHGFRPSELAEVGWLGARKLLTDGRFRALARRELSHGFRAKMLEAARRLVPDLDARHWLRWGPPGIRAQLVDRDTGQLVMDFVVEGDDRSLHVLNAISPGFTCSLPFADHLCDEMERLRA